MNDKKTKNRFKDDNTKAVGTTVGNTFPKTDLALETHEFNVEKGEDDGIITENYQINGYEITKTIVGKDKGEEQSGKRAGQYITVDVGELQLKSPSEFEALAVALSMLIKEQIPEGDGCILVAGIGNDEIVSDAIGPKTVSGVIASRHIKKLKKGLYISMNLGEVVAVQTGVMGTTGLESAEFVSALVEKLSPKCVIAVDSLASRRLSRLATTVQISNAGISPGAGVANRRLELNESTLGVPVIAIGIPTVVDAFTLVSDLVGSEHCEDLRCKRDNFFVAPKESDKIIKEASKLLSMSLNIALHGLTPSEIGELQ